MNSYEIRQLTFSIGDHMNYVTISSCLVLFTSVGKVPINYLNELQEDNQGLTEINMDFAQVTHILYIHHCARTVILKAIVLIFESCHTKTGLKISVNVIPKERLADTSQKKPSFGMAPTVEYDM